MENIQLFKVNMSLDIENYIIPTLKSGMITQGKKVDEFENKLKEYFNYPYILTLNSATSGLTLAYKLLNLNIEKDIVISTPLTCFATNASILANNLNIIWADTDIKTNNIDLEDVKNKINSNTKVLSFVHWGGVPVDLDKVDEIKIYAKKTFNTELNVIEDCAHAFGSEFNNKKLGTHGNICVFSLQAIKHLTTGDGGLIFLPNKELYERAKLLRWFGIDRERRSLPGSDFRLEPDISEYGFKYHMNDINACIGLSNLINIDDFINKCRENGIYYNENLKNILGIQLFDTNKKSNTSYWIYTLKILFNHKNDFISFMKEKGIVVSQVHARNDKHSCMSKFNCKLKNLDKIENQIVSIPVGWWIDSIKRKYICDCIKEFSQKLFQITKLEKKDIKEYSIILKQLNNFQNNYIKDISKETLDSIYVIKHENKIISTVKLIIEEKLYDNIAHIEDVVTDIEYRKRGFSKFLINYLTDIALNKLNCYKVVLNCKNEIKDFYEKCDFKIEGLLLCKR